MRLRGLACGGLVGLAGVLVALAAPAAARKQDEQAIRETSKAYLAALAKGDRKALAEFWTKDGYFVDELGDAHPAGELVAEIGQADPVQQPQLKPAPSEIHFISPDVAIEDGISEFVPGAAKGSSVRGHFHATWIRQDGHWKLASLCEIPIAPRAEEGLADLGWMVGTWTSDNAGDKVEVTVQWNATGTFLLRDMKAIHEGQVTHRGSQRFGWDPLTRKIRSWSFDSDGGYGETTWSRDGDSWVGQARGVLPDGRQTSATTVITFDGKDSFTRKVLLGRVEDEPTPDQELRYTRRTESE